VLGGKPVGKMAQGHHPTMENPCVHTRTLQPGTQHWQQRAYFVRPLFGEDEASQEKVGRMARKYIE
jgi:hypothetical protein